MITVDVDLGEHGEVYVVVIGRKGKNLFICPWFLVCKLVAGETQDAETVVGKLLMKRTQTCVLRRKASSAGDVDNEGNLAFVLREVDVFADYRLH